MLKENQSLFFTQQAGVSMLDEILLNNLEATNPRERMTAAHSLLKSSNRQTTRQLLISVVRPPLLSPLSSLYDDRRRRFGDERAKAKEENGEVATDDTVRCR